ncbi:CbiX/SirB N-terminal domain-containing protein [Streptomyces sp. NPDC047002]|uniref:sirohydrochlorin chelatase n=1 Tax=Streptomyces sp. NPDC047002 TaxID=3155475 RepID=UPI003452088D
MRAPTLVAAAHGTRDPAGCAVTEALLDRVRALRPGLRVVACYLDLAAPALPEVLAGLRGDAVLVPLLLGTGYHVRVDLPRALAGAPHLRARVAAPLGPHPLLAEALARRLARCGREGGPVVLAAAGSGDPAAGDGTRAMAALLAERLRAPVVAAYLSAAEPTPAQAVDRLRAAGHREVTVAPYLLGPGFFARAAARTAATRTAEPLAAHEAVARLVLLRHAEACAAPWPSLPRGGGYGPGRAAPDTAAVASGAGPA